MTPDGSANMRRHRLVLDRCRTAVGVAAFGVAACRSTTAPSEAVLRGTYVLRDVNGAALPATISNTSVRVLLIADTIRFDGAGTALASSTTREEYSGQEPRVVRTTVDLYYTVHADTIRIGIRCPPNANCTGPSTGHLVSRSVVTVVHGPAVYLYVRH
jgi:hypothetical protein